jgi:hypothetical protein
MGARAGNGGGAGLGGRDDSYYRQKYGMSKKNYLAMKKSLDNRGGQLGY